MASSQLRRVRLRFLLATALVAVLGLAGSIDAQASHFWMSGGKWVHIHTRSFDVYRTDINLWTASAKVAEDSWSRNTGLRVAFTDSHTGSEIHIIPGDYGDTGWAGLATVEAGWNGTTGHYTHGHNLYNWYYADTSARSLHVACHEIGHSLGLWHSTEPGSCMRSGTFDGGPSEVDKAELRSRYPATGH